MIVDHIIKKFGKIDILFNCAISLTGNIENDTRTNLINTYNLSYYVAKCMKNGKIVNFTSNIINNHDYIRQTINIPLSDYTIYSMTKKSLETMAEILRNKYKNVSFINFKIIKPIKSEITKKYYINQGIFANTNSLNKGIDKIIFSSDIKDVDNSDYNNFNLVQINDMYKYQFSKNIKVLNSINPIGHTKKINIKIKDIGEYNDNYDTLKKSIIKKNNYSFGTDNILFYNGLTEAFNTIFQILPHDSNIIVLKPTWTYINIIANKNNINIIQSNVVGNKINFNNILNLIDINTKLIYLTNPSFPFGNLIDKNEFDKFLIKKPKNIIVLIDECYHEYARSNVLIKPNEIYLGNNIIFARTFSKFYGLPSIRLGYTMQSNRLTNIIKKNILVFSINNLSIRLANIAINDNKFYNKSKEYINREYNKVINIFKKYNIKYYPSESIFILFRVNNYHKKLMNILFNHKISLPQENFNGFYLYIISDSKTNNLVLKNTIFQNI